MVTLAWLAMAGLILGMSFNVYALADVSRGRRTLHREDNAEKFLSKKERCERAASSQGRIQ